MYAERTDLRLRPAEARDARALAELWADAFPGEARVEVRLRTLLERSGPFGGLETCRVAEDDGGMVGAFRLFSLRMVLWGRPVPVQGVAAVAVAPHARRAGVGRWMCEAALREGREQGDLLSALYPFRADFYARLGYTLVGELHRYRFPAADLPVFPGADRVRPVDPEEAEAKLPEAYASILPGSHGLLERSPSMWRGILDGASRVWGFPGDEGALRGYLVASGRKARSPERSTLRVRELVAGDAEAYRALLGSLGIQRDQWPLIRYDAAPGENLQHLLAHPRIPDRPPVRGLWFPSATLLRGPMLRILDLPAVLSMAGGLEGGDAFPVRDEQLPGNDGVWASGPDGPARSPREEGDGPGWPIGLVTAMFANGELPGQAPTLQGWNPNLGIRDFRLLDVF